MEDHTVEQGFENIEKILEKMSSKDVSLEESFNLYKAGMEELSFCNSKITDTQKAVLAIQADGTLGVFEEE